MKFEIKKEHVEALIEFTTDKNNKRFMSWIFFIIGTFGYSGLIMLNLPDR